MAEAIWPAKPKMLSGHLQKSSLIPTLDAKDLASRFSGLIWSPISKIGEAPRAEEMSLAKKGRARKRGRKINTGWLGSPRGTSESALVLRALDLSLLWPVLL